MEEADQLLPLDAPRHQELACSGAREMSPQVQRARREEDTANSFRLSLLYWGVQDGAKYILHARPLVGGEAVSLGVRMNIDSAPAISPDGRFLVFGRDDGEGYDLIRLDLETMEEVRLTGGN